MIGNCFQLKSHRLSSSDSPEALSPWELSKWSVREDAYACDEYIASDGTNSNWLLDLEVLEKVIASTIREHRWKLFVEPVDTILFSVYYEHVPYPMCLQLILSRLRSGYYRRADALFWDLAMIYKDAHIFNEPTSNVVSEAKELVFSVISAVESKLHSTISVSFDAQNFSIISRPPKFRPKRTRVAINSDRLSSSSSVSKKARATTRSLRQTRRLRKRTRLHSR